MFWNSLEGSMHSQIGPHPTKKPKLPRYSLVMQDPEKRIFQIWDGGGEGGHGWPAILRACVQLHGNLSTQNVQGWAKFIVDGMNNAVAESKP